jgi:2-keto-4-pentenoate hydratase
MRYWCYLFARRQRPGWPVLHCDDFIAPRLAVAVGLELASDVTGAQAVGRSRSIVAARPIIELLDARTTGDDPWPATIIADSGRHALLVPGQRVELPAWSRQDALALRLRNGSEPGRLMRLPPQLHAVTDELAWLADSAAATGEPLRQGELIVAGRSSSPQPLLPGRTYWSELAGVGSHLAVAGVHTSTSIRPAPRNATRDTG